MKTFLQTLIFYLLLTQICLAQWISDPTTNLAVCIMDQTQRETRLCNDGAGNLFVFWRDYRNEPTIFGGDTYAQKLDTKGIGLWNHNGNSVITGSGGQFDTKVISDGEQGAYLVWRTSLNSFQDYSLHAQRINNNANKLWGSSNITVQAGLGTTLNQSVIMNEDGDLLIVWQLGLTGIPNSMDIYAQKINSNGDVQWSSNGLPVCLTTAFNILGPKIISDQKGGAFISWNDNRNDLSKPDIYAQRINSNGTPLWAANGIPVCTNAGSQGTKHIFSDNNGGAILFWEDIQETTYSIYGQRIDSTGNKLWEPDGRILYSTTAPFSQFEFVLDKNKEIFFLWLTSEGNIYAQKVDYNGNLVWGNSIPLCTTQSAVSYLAAHNSDVNGIVVGWLDNRNGNYDIYSQWINADGNAMWNNNGVAICNEVHEQSDYSITSDNFGGAVITWADMRNGNFDVYAQNIDLRGKLGSNRYQFKKGNLNKTISNAISTPDSLLVTLPILEGTGYYGITVLLDTIIHSAVDELSITLTHMGITDTIAYSLSGGQNFINTYLDDFALNLISTSAAPFTGIYKPYNPLAVFIGSDLNGEWILEIKDNLAGNDGILKSWGMLINKGELTDIDLDPETAMLNDFRLFQNYPNPFNPGTKISWQSPVGSWQTLKVFDVLGREIETIVDGYYESGSHSTLYIVNSSLPSGVYFYQLKAGDFIQTKKMIFLK